MYAFKSSEGVGRKIWKVLVAILYIVTGGYLLVYPLIGLSGLTLLLAMFFLVEGITHIGTLIWSRKSVGSEWLLLHGVVTLFLGLMIWKHWPISSLWALETLVGISMLIDWHHPSHDGCQDSSIGDSRFGSLSPYKGQRITAFFARATVVCLRKSSLRAISRRADMASKVMTSVTQTENDWERPRAMAIPKEGYFKCEQGNYGPIFPRTPACYGFTVIASQAGQGSCNACLWGHNRKSDAR